MISAQVLGSHSVFQAWRNEAGFLARRVGMRLATGIAWRDEGIARHYEQRRCTSCC